MNITDLTEGNTNDDNCAIPFLQPRLYNHQRHRQKLSFERYGCNGDTINKCQKCVPRLNVQTDVKLQLGAKNFKITNAFDSGARINKSLLWVITLRVCPPVVSFNNSKILFTESPL